MHHIGTRLALTCSLVLLSACSERVSFLAPKFQMGPNNAQALVVTPDGEVHESGKLTVSIRGFLDTLTKKRRLLATLADVEKVVVEVSASGLSFSQTIAKADLDNGTTSATFTGIPEGTATVTMKAYNLTNQLIGQASKATSVTAGATTTVEIQLQLDPTYTQPSSGGSSNTGSITANGTIIDGPVIEGTPPPPSGTVISVIQPDYTMQPPGHFDLDSLGNAWQVVLDNSYNEHLIQQSPSGTELKRFPIAASTGSFAQVLVDGSDAIWYIGAGGMTKLTPDGTELFVNSGLNADSYWGTALQEDGQGNVWVNAVEGLFKYASGGTPVGQATFEPTVGTFASIHPGSIAVDGSGQLWVLYHGIDWHADGGTYVKEAWITRHDSDGVELQRFSVPVPPVTESDSAPMGTESQFAVGSDGTLWYGNVYSNQLHRVQADGTLLGTITLGGGGIRVMEIDSSGYLWIGTGSELHKLSPSGETLLSIPLSKQGAYMADPPYEIAIGVSGVWVSGTAGYDKLVVAP